MQTMMEMMKTFCRLSGLVSGQRGRMLVNARFSMNVTIVGVICGGFGVSLIS